MLNSIRGSMIPAGLAAALLLAGQPPDAQAQQPNIVMFMVDDLGWTDGASFGSQYYETPNIDRLRERGLYFTNAYSANPLCSPTRASIMTGQYPGRLNFTAASGHTAPNPDAPPIRESAASSQRVVIPTSRNQLDPSYYTLPELLGDAGYDTYFMGKWHLGSPSIYWPDAQGFDVNIGGAGNPGPPSFFSPHGLNNLSDGPVGEHVDDRMAREYVGILDQRAAENDTDPFFICWWAWGVHAPFQAKEEYIEYYRGKTDPTGRHDCTTMGGMIQSIDDSVGVLLDELDARGLTDDTIIVFFSDNGGNMYSEVTDSVTGFTTTPTNNAPLRSGKGNMYEGGVRVPAIISWPGVTTPNSTTNAFLMSQDWYATFGEWAGATFDADQALDGVSFVEYLQGTASAPREEVYIHFPHYIAATDNLPGTSVRQGDWKLYRFYGEGPDLTNVYELYNLAGDPSESNNLYGSEPAIAANLTALLDQHVQNAEYIVPFPNPNFAEPVGGWEVTNNMRLLLDGGTLRATMLGHDPHMTPVENLDIAGPTQLQIRLRIQGVGNMQVFWNAQGDPGFAAGRSSSAVLTHDGEWATYTVDLQHTTPLRTIRIDPGTEAGAADFDWIRLYDQSGTTLQHSWEFGGDWDGRAFEPYLPLEGWEAQNQLSLTELNGYARADIEGADPFMVSPAFGPHQGPLTLRLRLRSEATNHPLPSQIMWVNSEGSFGIAPGRGLNFNQTHDGTWREYEFDITTPDIQRLRFDPLQGSTDGQIVDIDWIRVYSGGTTKTVQTLLEEWDFGGPVQVSTSGRDLIVF